MSDPKSNHDDETKVNPEGYQPPHVSPGVRDTVRGAPLDNPTAGDTDVYDQLEADNDPFIGETLGHYHILSKLGQGGFGSVYKARDIKLDRYVAVKFLNEHMDSEIEKLFEREAKILANLSKNSNIVQIYTWGEYKGRKYMVLEHMDQSVQALVNNHLNGLPVKDALKIAASCCEALVYAHTQGVLHRDIKPANILMDAQTKQTKLCDFGLARFYNKGIDNTTQTIAGSPNFMPVEQIRGKNIDERSDIYSLGVTLYQLLSGRLPFDGDSQYEIMEKVRSTKGTPLPTHRAGLPRIVYDIVHRAKAQKPDDRFQSAVEFKDALDSAIRAIEDTGSADSARLDVSKPKWPRIVIASALAAGIGLIAISGIFTGDNTITFGPDVLAETKAYIESGLNLKAEPLLRGRMKTNADSETAYQLAYALQRSGQTEEAQKIVEMIEDPALKREINAVLAHAKDGGKSRPVLVANVEAFPDAYSVVLLAMLDLISRNHEKVIARLEKFDDSSLYFEWQKQSALQTLGQAYFAVNNLDGASAKFAELQAASNQSVSERADEFAEIIADRRNIEKRAALVAQAESVSLAIAENDDYDRWTSQPLRIRIKEPRVDEKLKARIAKEGINEFLPYYLNRALSVGVGRPISIVNRTVLDEILFEKNLLVEVGDEADKDIALNGIFGVRYLVTPEFFTITEDEMVRFIITSVATTQEIFLDDDFDLPPRGSGKDEWKKWVTGVEISMRKTLSAEYRLQGLLSHDADGLILNIGSAVGVEKGMEFTLHNGPNSRQINDYKVRVTGDIGGNQCRVQAIEFTPATAQGMNWHAMEAT
ncbi:serine/threonine protein kinase [bacterium AH-315-P07]|nr:serine/threonine protein kinase [bacterium AH-315-P07]